MPFVHTDIVLLTYLLMPTIQTKIYRCPFTFSGSKSRERVNAEYRSGMHKIPEMALFLQNENITQTLRPNSNLNPKVHRQFGPSTLRT